MNPARIEITSGVLSSPARVECGGLVSLDFSNVGQLLYFVEIVEADGSRIGLYDGPFYAAALAEACRFARGEGIPVHDLAGGA
jgi:hypothetical protein